MSSEHAGTPGAPVAGAASFRCAREDAVVGAVVERSGGSEELSMFCEGLATFRVLAGLTPPSPLRCGQTSLSASELWGLWYVRASALSTACKRPERSNS